MSVVPFDMLKSQLQIISDKMDLKRIIAVVETKNGYIQSGWTGTITNAEACEMVCRLINHIFEDKIEEQNDK